MTTDLELAKAILEFLALHAKENASYEPGIDGPEDRFNGPDSAMFYAAAEALKAGLEPPFVHSSFGSGCYRGWQNKDLEAVHDDLLKAVNDRIFVSTVSAPVGKHR